MTLRRLATWCLVSVLAVQAAEDLRLRTLSARPGLITGNSVLVEIRAPSFDALRVTLNGHDVSKAFHPGSTPGTLLGVVEGLKPGKNRLQARAAGKKARIDLRNHPSTVAVFSGLRQTLFACRTERAGLGAPLDSDCTAHTRVSYYYKSTAPPPAAASGAPADSDAALGFKPLDPATPRPSDLARTTTSEGRTVNYIVRREMGTINRAIYSITFLHEPGQPLPDPWRRNPGWNGRLVYEFGGGCRAGYRQANLGSLLNDALLSKGYALAESSLNVFNNNCDDVISAETVMMVKEHFIRNYGLPVYTIGTGGSGGSMQQHLIAQNYPGLLDGITPAASYPDITTLVAPATDCTLLARVFEGSSQAWTEEQKTAVSGFATWRTCGSWMKSRYSPGWIQPGFCDASIPRDQVYDPVKNPRGVRCTLQDNEVNVYGRDKKTGFAPQFIDNTGVQYGLTAFNEGRINAAQFVELNERIGGFDLDGNIVPHRTVATSHALRTA